MIQSRINELRAVSEKHTPDYPMVIRNDELSEFLRVAEMFNAEEWFHLICGGTECRYCILDSKTCNEEYYLLEKYREEYLKMGDPTNL